jgi:folate-dependent tRNA-U54 methylase TrmFO/GidA
MKPSKTLSPKQKKIAQVAGDPNKIEGEDFKKLKPMKANEGIFAKLKKLRKLKKEAKKIRSYSKSTYRSSRCRKYKKNR